MATYLLVHGAWHGGWCWRRVSDILRNAGHTVFTPTLTGLGERAHLASADTDLDCHINDVLGVIDMEELDDVILCGHSYGGQVITPVLDRRIDEFRAAIWLDAFVPQDGQSLEKWILDDGLTETFSFMGDGVLTFDEYLASGEPEFFFVGITQSDGDRAWSAPVWINHPR